MKPPASLAPDDVPAEARDPVLPRLGDGGAAEAWGGKAASLDELLRAGFSVPAGFVVPHRRDPEALAGEELSAAVEAIGGFPVAVRSSGVLEDLEDASFAGQYDTVLDVGDVEALMDAIAACKRSAQNERVREYAAKRALAPEDAAVSVLVQRMVRPVLAGVAFTIHPLTGKEEHALVELVSGLGERLVSGQTTPTSATIRLDGGEVVDEAVGSDGARLLPEQAEELARALLAIQAHFGRPQDVEWAIDRDGALHILQARPITRVQWRRDVGEQTSADFREGGVSARVCTPLMYGLYRRATTESMQQYFEAVRLIRRGQNETWIGFYYGRPYWSASAVKRALARVPGFDEEQFDRGLGIQKDYGEAGPLRVPWSPRVVAGAIPIALALRAEYAAHLARVERFGEPFFRAYRRWRARIDSFYDTSDAAFFSDLEELFRFQLDTERTYFRTIYNNSNAQSDLHTLIARMDRATGRATIVTKLLGGLAGVHHMAMQQGIVRLVQVAREAGTEGEVWRKALAEFLREHGFHGDVELDITVPRWESAPERVRELVEALAASGAAPADPDEALARQEASFEEERSAVRAALRSSLWARLRFSRAFESKLSRARAFLSAREQMREYSTRCYALLRHYVLEAGARLVARGALDASDDVFMLDPDEIVELGVSGPGADDHRARIARRRAYYQGYRNVPAPGEFGAGVSERPAGGDAGDGRVLEGLGCSAGVVTGVVRVVADLSEVRHLKPGEILVTRFTDPGWTPSFGIIGAVVTEVGGLLSHAAVIGREYGIPAVLNLPGATRHLRTGDRVRVDGSRGTVEILDEEVS